MLESTATVRDEFDVPLGGLQPRGHLRYERSHIETVVAEFRFAASETQLPQETALDIWARLGTERFPHVEATQLQSLSIQVTPGRTEHVTATQQGWALTDTTRKTSVILLPAALIVSVGNYERYSTSIGSLADEALSAFASAGGPAVVQRIGLRYVNRLTNNSALTADFWASALKPSFSGPLSEAEIGQRVVSLQQQVSLRLTPTAGATIQHGVIQPDEGDETVDYLIDIDAFDEQARPTDTNACANELRRLNRTALALFSIVLSDSYLKSLNPISIEQEATQ